MNSAASNPSDLSHMRRIAGEGVLLAGGARAILLQVAHSAVGRGVAEHSDFAARPLDRLGATMSFVYGVVFGTAAQTHTVSVAVNQAHRRVVGPGYAASDPGLQLWVAATLYDTAVDLYQRIFGPLSEQLAEQVYREYAVLGTALQMPASLWPADRAAFAAYWADALGTLRVTDQARSVAHDLLSPNPIALRALAPPTRLLTTGLLPPGLRSDYGLAWSPVRQRAFDLLMRGLALTYPRLPLTVREVPKSYYLHRLGRP